MADPLFDLARTTAGNIECIADYLPQIDATLEGIREVLKRIAEALEDQ